jgi:hypothetical protein
MEDGQFVTVNELPAGPELLKVNGIVIVVPGTAETVLPSIHVIPLPPLPLN